MYNSKDKIKNFAVYCHYFPNGKVYVGLTCHGEDIESKRFGHNGCKYSKQPLVWRAIQKYGWNNIEHVVIAKGISRESAINIEKDLIELYKSNDRKYGYNLSGGGEEGSYHTEESRKKMSEYRKGRPKSEEHKRKIGEAHRGIKLSDEAKEKIRKSATGRHQDTDNDPRNIPVFQYDINTKQLVGVYLSISKAARDVGLSKSHISECAKDKRRQEGNCIWIYESMATDEYIQKRLSRF